MNVWIYKYCNMNIFNLFIINYILNNFKRVKGNIIMVSFMLLKPKKKKSHEIFSISQRLGLKYNLFEVMVLHITLSRNKC